MIKLSVFVLLLTFIVFWVLGEVRAQEPSTGEYGKDYHVCIRYLFRPSMLNFFHANSIEELSNEALEAMQHIDEITHTEVTTTPEGIRVVGFCERNYHERGLVKLGRRINRYLYTVFPDHWGYLGPENDDYQNEITCPEFPWKKEC